jgi:16S rRNA (guanine527-N7)-methyltransferase
MDELFSGGAAQWGLSLTPHQLSLFDQYRRELLAWNEKINLTRIVDPDEITVKHFLDSLSMAAALPNLAAKLSLIDVGAGAGFPGIPLKIALPHLRLTLLEATGKKTDFLRHVVESLALPHVTVVKARAEEAGQQPAHRQQYDVAVARAVSALPVLLEYTLPLVKVGGLVIAAKGQSPQAEAQQAAAALRILGGRIERIVPVTVPGLDAARHLVIVKKIRPTPKNYPRRPGLPAKNPLSA